MYKEYGGYLSLELRKGKHYYKKSDDINILNLNSGRSAILASLKNKDVNKVYIPYYNCNVVEKALLKEGYKTQKYLLDDNLYPIVKDLKNNDYLLYINYFGVNFSLGGGISLKLI